MSTGHRTRSKTAKAAVAVPPSAASAPSVPSAVPTSAPSAAPSATPSATPPSAAPTKVVTETRPLPGRRSLHQNRAGVKSGRSWKKKARTRTSAATRPVPRTWAFKAQVAARAERETVKAINTLHREDVAEKKAELKRKREEKARRRAENEMKSAVYQEIKNPEKLKKMSKKQLRMIKRVRVNPDGVKELAGAYEK